MKSGGGKEQRGVNRKTEEKDAQVTSTKPINKKKRLKLKYVPLCIDMISAFGVSGGGVP